MFIVKRSHYVLMLHLISKAFYYDYVLVYYNLWLSLKIMKYSPIKLGLFSVKF